MPDLKLSVDFDKEGAYHPGETVTGEVVVESDESVDCSELTARCFWETDGSGTPDRDRERSQQIFDGGEWEAGETYSYGFDFEIMSPGPYTYRGTEVSVEWCVEVRADVPWSFDPEKKAAFRVEPTGGERRFRPGPEPLQEVRGEILDSDDPSAGCQAGIGLALLLPAVALVGFVGMPADCDAESTESIGNILGAGTVGLVMVGYAIRRMIAQATFGGIEFDVDGGDVVRGQEVDCRLVLPARLEEKFRQLDLKLVRFEEAEDDRGRHETTHTHEEVVDSVTPAGRDTGAGSSSSGVHRHTFEIPEDADFSFCSAHNEVGWEVRLHVDAPWWPDWHDREPLLVRPDLRESESAEEESESEGTGEVPGDDRHW